MVIIILTIDGYKNLNAYRHTFKSELYKDSTRVVWNLKKYDFSTRKALTVSLEIVCCQTQKIKTQIKCLGTRFTYTSDDRTVDNIIFLNIINIIIKLYTYYIPTQNSYISCLYIMFIGSLRSRLQRHEYKFCGDWRV